MGAEGANSSHCPIESAYVTSHLLDIATSVPWGEQFVGQVPSLVSIKYADLLSRINIYWVQLRDSVCIPFQWKQWHQFIFHRGWVHTKVNSLREKKNKTLAGTSKPMKDNTSCSQCRMGNGAIQCNDCKRDFCGPTCAHAHDCMPQEPIGAKIVLDKTKQARKLMLNALASYSLAIAWRATDHSTVMGATHSILTFIRGRVEKDSGDAEITSQMIESVIMLQQGGEAAVDQTFNRAKTRIKQWAALYAKPSKATKAGRGLKQLFRRAGDALRKDEKKKGQLQFADEATLRDAAEKYGDILLLAAGGAPASDGEVQAAIEAVERADHVGEEESKIAKEVAKMSAQYKAIVKGFPLDGNVGTWQTMVGNKSLQIGSQVRSAEHATMEQEALLGAGDLGPPSRRGYDFY